MKKLLLTIMIVLFEAKAFAVFAPPYADEPRTLQQITEEFQNWADSNPGPSGTSCPVVLQRQVSQKLFNDANFRRDAISSFSNHFGVNIYDQEFSNAFADEAVVRINTWGIVCTGGYEQQTCTRQTGVDICNIYNPIHFIPNLDPNGVGQLSGKVIP